MPFETHWKSKLKKESHDFLLDCADEEFLGDNFAGTLQAIQKLLRKSYHAGEQDGWLARCEHKADAGSEG